MTGITIPSISNILFGIKLPFSSLAKAGGMSATMSNSNDNWMIVAAAILLTFSLIGYLRRKRGPRNSR